MAENEAIPFYEPGGSITGEVATADVTGKTFVEISGNRTTAGNVAIDTATAAGRIFGVAAHDAAVGEVVDVMRTPGIVVPVTASGAIAAFEEVEVGAAGAALALAAGIAVGFALTAAADGEDAQICLY